MQKTRALIREEELRRLDLSDKIEAAREEGFKLGYQLGLQLVMQASQDDIWNAATINIAKTLLENNEPIDKIMLYTQLPIETISSLKSDKNVDPVTKN